MASSWRCVSIHSNTETPQQEASESLRILSYNIAHGRGLATSNWQGGTIESKQQRLADIAELLRSRDADIVVLNEVDFESSWSSCTNQAAFLAKGAGYKYWAEQRNLDFRVLTWKWRFGNAVLSRHPIVESRAIDLPGFSSIESILAGKKRGLDCLVEVHDQKVRILAVHLCHRSEAIREQSAEILRERVASDSTTTIIAGDFNSSPEGFPDSESDPAWGNAIDRLDASELFSRRPVTRPTSDSEFTYHSAKPTSTIDWILAPRESPFLEYSIVPSTLSDHRPVWAQISLGHQSEMGHQTERRAR